MQQSIQSRSSPPTAQERSHNPSSVAVVKPMSQFKNPKPHSPYLQQANIDKPIINNVQPPLLLGSGSNCNEQRQINFMEGATTSEDARVWTDNPQTMKHKVVGDEKQKYRKHYEDCQARQNRHRIDSIIPLGHNVSINKST